MKKLKITAVILTKNEQNNIFRCLDSLRFCQEIVVLDDYSSDNTMAIVNNFKKEDKNKIAIKIFQRNLGNNFSNQRNFGLKIAQNNWVLFIDGDEIVSIDLKKEIEKFFSQPNQLENIDGFYIKRRDFFWGREVRFGEVLKVRSFGLLRLVRKNCGYWQGNVHEVFQPKKINFKTKILKNFLDHYPHQNLKEFLAEINFYSTIRAKELFKQGKKASLFEIIFFPLFKFILNYFIYLGFLDGVVGFVYAFLMSFHSFLVRSKLFQYQIEKQIYG